MFESADYFETAAKPVNYSPNLWKVNDIELSKPGERFISDKSPYLDAIIETGIAGDLQSASMPQGLIKYVEAAVKMFGALPSKHSSVHDVMNCVMRWLDFGEFYYLLFNSAVQHNANQFKYTYRLKKNNAVLSPSNLECFNVAYGYGFDQYRDCCEFLGHPSIQDALQGKQVTYQGKGRPITKTDILEKLCTILYGHFEGLQSEVEDWVLNHYEHGQFMIELTDEEILNLDSEKERDTRFWLVCMVAALMWFKSRYALKFLSEFHPVYRRVLKWDGARNDVVVIPESGGEVVVDCWRIYTRDDLIVEETKPPGTCESCKNPLHCTKYVNAQALFHPVCSCGELVPVEDTDFGGHGWRGECKAYLREFAPFNAYVCQKCMYAAVNNLNPATKCQRAICPATSCPHHIGSHAHAQELTKRRTLLLTSR